MLNDAFVTGPLGNQCPKIMTFGFGLRRPRVELVQPVGFKCCVISVFDLWFGCMLPVRRSQQTADVRERDHWYLVPGVGMTL